jgi:ABC-2 type transport system permease protein
MWSQARAIVWAQWRSVRNHLPGANKSGLAFTILIGLAWYGGFAVLAALLGSVMSDPNDIAGIQKILPTILLISFLYWQLIPVLMASMGSSIDLKKLLVYPVPYSQLFTLEVLLRITASFEVLIVLAGIGIGLAINPRIPGWAPGWMLVFAVFNLFLLAGLRDLLRRLLARKRIGEVIVFLMVMSAALPQLLIVTGAPAPIRRLFAAEPISFTPWIATAHLVQGKFTLAAAIVLLLWAAAAYLFGRWQFARGLRFDAAEGNATPELSSRRWKGFESIYRLPSAILPDPLGALIEKDARSLLRSPRFRLVFTMGFSFGLLIWLPMTFGQGRSPNSLIAGNYLIFVSLYALMMLSDALFWNMFGFDRSASQVYFLAPVKLSTVLLGKNLVALFFVLLEITLITLVCVALRLPFSLLKMVEAFAVTIMTAIVLLSVGNLTSIYNPRPVDPSKSFRTAASGRAQAVLMLAFPLALAPVLLAFAARYAFRSELAFFGVLLAAMAFSAVFYRVSIESAVATAEERREKMIATLSRGEGPIES